MLLLPEGARGLYSQHSNSMSEKTKPLARVTQGSVQDGTAGPWLSCRFSFFWSRASLKMSNGIWGFFFFFLLEGSFLSVLSVPRNSRKIFILVTTLHLGLGKRQPHKPWEEGGDGTF